MNNFEQACLLSNEEWIESFPVDIEHYSYTEQHIKQIKKLFNKMRNDKYHKLTKRSAYAVLIAAIILSISITAFAIPKSRNYLINKFSDHSSYSVTDYSGDENVTSLNIGYLPDGFEKTNETYSDDFIMNQFSFGDEWFYVCKYDIGTVVDFDTEDYNEEHITIDNIEYILYNSNSEYCGIIWNNGYNVFTIAGNVSLDMLLEIAQNIE
jgi:hypothetical protein